MFDAKNFKKRKFTDRTDEVAVPELKEWFDKKEKPVWKVRGLSGKEIGAGKDAAAKNKNLAGIIEMLTSSGAAEKTDALKALTGLGKNDVPENIAERLEMMVNGSTGPKCDLDLALKMCARFPVPFYAITNKILSLTGLGMMPGELKGSTEKRT